MRYMVENLHEGYSDYRESNVSMNSIALTQRNFSSHRATGAFINIIRKIFAMYLPGRLKKDSVGVSDGGYRKISDSHVPDQGNPR